MTTEGMPLGEHGYEPMPEWFEVLSDVGTHGEHGIPPDVHEAIVEAVKWVGEQRTAAMYRHPAGTAHPDGALQRMRRQVEVVEAQNAGLQAKVSALIAVRDVQEKRVRAVREERREALAVVLGPEAIDLSWLDLLRYVRDRVVNPLHLVEIKTETSDAPIAYVDNYAQKENPQ